MCPVLELWNFTALVQLLSSLTKGREVLTKFAQCKKIHVLPGTKESTVEKTVGIVTLISSIETAVQGVQNVRIFMLDPNPLCSNGKPLVPVGGVEGPAVTMPLESGRGAAA